MSPPVYLTLHSLTYLRSMWVTLANLPLQFGYPFLKRITYWPSFFLGVSLSISSAGVRLTGPFQALHSVGVR